LFPPFFNRSINISVEWMVLNEKGYSVNLLKNIGEKKPTRIVIFFYKMQYVSKIPLEVS